MGYSNIWWRIMLAYAAYSTFLFQCFGVMSPYLFETDRSLISQGYYWGSSIVNIITLVICAFFNRPFRKFFGRTEALIASGFLCTCGCLISGLASPADAIFKIEFFASIVATGCGTAGLYFCLALAFLRLDQREAIIGLFASFFLALVINSLISFTQGLLSLLIACLLPMVAIFLLGHEGLRDSQDDAPSLGKNVRPLGKLLIKLAVFIVAFSIISGAVKRLFLVGPTRWSGEMAITLVAIATCAVALALISSYLFKALDAVIVYRAVFFVTMVSLAILLENSRNIDVVFAVQRVSGELFRCLLFVFCLKLSLRTAYSPVAIFGYSLSFLKVMTVGVSIALSLVPGLQEACTNQLTLVCLCLIMVITFVYLFIFNESDVANLMETNHVLTTREANEMRCDNLSKKAKLSPREHEVLLLYSQGKTLKAIANELHLSENTVSMYRRKLYVKLDIHSKQELLELLEQEE